MERFEELKKIILERARAAEACREQYGRAYKAENLADLMKVVRDNFYWAVNNSVIDGELIDTYKAEFNEGRIWHNENTAEGCLLASGSATVKAYGSATVKAYGSATVKAYDSATVKAYCSATVKAYGSATVEAYGSATVEAYGSATVKAYGSATVEAYGSATVEAYDSATVKASCSATVKAYGSAYICSWSVKECQLNDHAVYRIMESNTIRYVDPNIKFEKIRNQ